MLIPLNLRRPLEYASPGSVLHSSFSLQPQRAAVYARRVCEAISYNGSARDDSCRDTAT